MMKVLPSSIKKPLPAIALTLATLSAGLVATPAQATIILGQADAICTSNVNGGNDTDFLAGCGLVPADLTKYYKQNRGGTEEGTFADSYTTTFSPATEALITWDGAPDPFISCPDCYVIAKDGDSEPNWFLFDLGSWDGKEAIDFDPLFFKGTINQNFSHVTIWGLDDTVDPPVLIPEPASIALVGFAMAAAGLSSRRKRAA
ncbi:MAG: PEP-CTERM sorting domain-containing protein [Rubrivivax sp.]|nr:PEP-CTERM sorting domain-containing protein [Rubrivivax sp.]